MEKRATRVGGVGYIGSEKGGAKKGGIKDVAWRCGERTVGFRIHKIERLKLYKNALGFRCKIDWLKLNKSVRISSPFLSPLCLVY